MRSVKLRRAVLAAFVSAGVAGVSALAPAGAAVDAGPAAEDTAAIYRKLAEDQPGVSELSGPVEEPEAPTTHRAAAVNDCQAPPRANTSKWSCVQRQSDDVPRRSIAELNAAASAGPTTAASTQAIQPIPAWCGSDKYASRRTGMCEHQPWAYGVYGRVQGQPARLVGQIFYDRVQYIFTHRSEGTFANQIQFIPDSSWGRVGGTTVDGLGLCYGDPDCRVTDSEFPAQPFSATQRVAGESLQTTDVAARGERRSARVRWTWTFRTPGFAPFTQSTDISPYVRCDNDMPGTTRVGCVVRGHAGGLDHRPKGGPDLIRHIQAAQRSGLPGRWPLGTPLRRLVGKAAIEANRNAACLQRWRGRGLSCDEYPFASTKQGAKSSPGPARTFPHCDISDLPTGVRGPNGQSVCRIPLGQNSYGGSILNSFYADNRILDNDAFRVRVED